MKSIRCLFVFLFTGIIFFSCKKEYSCEGCINGNKPPIADAGTDQAITLPKDSVSLDGSASSDPDGTITSYKWTKITGPASANIANPGSSTTIVKNLGAGVYRFELTVTDNGGLSAKDTVQILVDGPGNQPPVACAGADQTITLPANLVTLDGSCSADPDNNITTYAWTKISGPSTFSIVNANAVQTQVTNLVQGVYSFELKVTDAGGLFSKDTVQIVVNAPGNQPPVACAGADQTITLPINTVNLDGSCSTDPDNNITAYQWTKISGPSSFNITNAASVQTQIINLVQGTYQFELKVTDAGGLFSKDTVQVTVNAAVATIICGDTNRTRIYAQLIPIGTLSQKRSYIAVAAAGNKVLFAGGMKTDPGDPNSSRVDIYDIASNSWSTAELSIGRSYGITALSAGNKVFFAGGQASDGTWPTNNVDIYDVSANTWTVTHLSLGGENIAAARVGDKIIFAGGQGGFSGGMARSKRVDLYQLSTNTWATAQLPAYKMEGHNAVAFNNKVYISGGLDFDLSTYTSIISNKVDIYDNATNTWSTGTMQEGKSYHSGIVAGNNMYWAGGVVSANPYVFSCSVEIKSPGNGSSQTQYLHAPGIRNAVIKNNKIVYYSGANKFDIYDLSTNTWSIGVLQVDILNASVISVNNTIYLAGGYVNNVLSDQVWKLDF